MTSVAAVAITNLLVVRGGRRVLQAISCEIAAGSVAGLLGPSGCGKTTLMRAIVGVQIVESGEIRVLDQHAGAAHLRRRVGYVTQAPSVYGDLSVRENLGYFAGVLGAGEARIAEVIETVSLTAEAAPGDRKSVGRTARACVTGNRPAGEPGGTRARRADGGPRPGAAPRPLGPLPAPHQLGESRCWSSSHVMDEAEHCDELFLMRDGADDHDRNSRRASPPEPASRTSRTPSSP